MLEYLVRNPAATGARGAQYRSPLDWLDAEPRTVTHPTRGRIMLEPRDYQREVLAAWDHPRRIIVKSRQIGFTQILAMEAYWKARHAGPRTILCVAQREENAAEFIRYVREQSDPDELSRDNELSVRFKNGSRVKAQAATKNPGRGYPASDVYLDEFAFAPWDTSVWQSIAPSVSTGGTITIFSSPRGRANLFYHIWAGQFGDTDWWRRSYSWRVLWDDPWAEARRRSMTREGFAEEYEAADGFLSTGGVLLDSKDVEACFVEGCESGPRPGRLYRLYCDPAGSGKDATVLQVWDVTARPYTLVHQDRWIIARFARLYNRAARLAQTYGCNVLRVDRTGLGEPIVEELEHVLEPHGCEVEPFLFTKPSKEAGLTAVRMLFEERAVRFSDAQLKAEALTYQLPDDDLMTDSLMTLLLMASQMRDERGDAVEDITDML